MLDYVVKETELPKGFTLGEYVKLKGLTEKDWLLIYDENEKLLTGVRADGLTASEKDYYIVTVQHHIFPIYESHSDRGYYIVVYISKTPVDVIPKFCTLTEVQVPDDTEKTFGMVDTNIGEMPVEDYKDIVAIQNGFNNYDDMLAEETTSEPEQPAEKNNQGVELTSLERILFEEHQKCLSSSISYLNMAHEAESEEEHDMYLSDASSATLIFGYISKIINQACLAGKYSAWLQERKEQKAVGASK